MRLWSREGRGSTFTIRLPLIESPHDEPPRKRVRKEKKVKKKTKLQGSDAVLTEGAVHVALDRTGTPDRSGIAAREGNGETA